VARESLASPKKLWYSLRAGKVTGKPVQQISECCQGIDEELTEWFKVTVGDRDAISHLTSSIYS